MKIKVCEENQSKIEDVLQAANGRASLYVISSFYEVAHFCSKTESRLEICNVPKSKRKGIVINVLSGGKTLPKSYKRARKCTGIQLVRGKYDWFIVAVSSRDLYPNQSGYAQLILTDEQKGIVAKNLFSLFYNNL